MYRGLPTQVVELPGAPVTTLNDLAGGTSIVYIGYANPNRGTVTLTVASFSAANPGIVGVTGHGLADDNGVYIAGATGDWAALNGAWYRVVWSSTNAFSLKTLAGVAVDTSAFTGSFDGTMTTNAPRTCDPIWYIMKQFYSGTDVVRICYGRLASASFGHQIWDNRASLLYD